MSTKRKKICSKCIHRAKGEVPHLCLATAHLCFEIMSACEKEGEECSFF